MTEANTKPTKALFQVRALKWLAAALAVGAFGVYLAHEIGAADGRHVERLDAEAAGWALVAYADANKGALPESWEQLLAARHGLFFEDESDPSVITWVTCPTHAATCHLTPEELKGNFRTVLGLSAVDITVDDTRVLGPDGRPILILAPVGESKLPAAVYRRLTVDIARAMKKAASAG